MKKLLLILAMLTAVVVACGPAAPSESATATPASAATSETVSEPSETSETVTVPNASATLPSGGTVTASGLQYIETLAGTGDFPAPGDNVSVNYVGKLQDGTVFDSSENAGQPITFQLGTGQVIPGWDEGIALMKKGGKATLVIPPDLAYGEQGAGGVIPPNATLVFDVELVDIKPAPTPAVVEADQFTTTDSGLQYYDFVVGEGDTPENGDLASIEFSAWVKDGSFLGSSADQGQPLTFTIGNGDLLPGWEEGVASMQAGGKRQLVLPPALAFGEEGQGRIPANATLIIEVELVSFRKPPTLTQLEDSEYTTTDSGLKYHDFTVGDGEIPQTGQTVVVQYTGWLEDGTKFDSSLDHGQPFSFVLGTEQVIPGWDEGVATMHVGGHRQLLVPPDLGYGESGYSGLIPPNATLIFDIELLSIEP